MKCSRVSNVSATPTSLTTSSTFPCIPLQTFKTNTPCSVQYSKEMLDIDVSGTNRNAAQNRNFSILCLTADVSIKVM